MNLRYYICDTCCKIWSIEDCYDTSERILCPDSECAGTQAFHVDEQMAPVIQILMKKGYQTQFCCSAHASEVMKTRYVHENPDGTTISEPRPYLNGYIAFKHCYYFQNIPDGWFLNVESDYGYNEDCGVIATLRMTDTTIPIDTPRSELWAIAQSVINYDMNNITKWALSLPYQEYDSAYDYFNAGKYSNDQHAGKSVFISKEIKMYQPENLEKGDLI